MASTSMGSSSVTLDNVDDYLAPSQACVNPAFQPTNKLGDVKDGENANRTESSSGNVIVPRRRRRIVRKKLNPMATKLDESTSEESGAISMSGPVSKTVEGETKKVVKASMADCLACSGCVTTAETVMMEERHSLKSLRKRLNSKGGINRNRVITLSPNSWADLCRHWNLDVPEKSEEMGDETKSQNFYLSRFTTLLSRILSVKMVVDGNVPLQWAWMDEAKEFCEVYEKNDKESVNGGEWGTSDAPLPSMAIDSTKTLYYKKDGSSETKDNRNRPSPIMPLISGSCPALVCLVEKSLTKLVPHLSQAVSPMSLVGMILKDVYNDGTRIDAPKDGIDNDNTTKNSGWDHWAIMPCHDKKLEASRKDFALNSTGEQAVDLVISTKECVELVEEWIISQGVDQASADMTVAKYLASLPSSDVSTTILEPNELLKILPCSTTESPLLVTAPVILCEDGTDSSTTTTQKQMAFSSGGHANYIFRYAAKRLFGCSLENENGLEWKAASLAMKNVRSARLGKLLKQHYYEAKLYRYDDGSYGFNQKQSDAENNDGSSTVVLHFAIAHGMQTMQRALKQVDRTPSRDNVKNSTLHYLEAMACPHGCVNGGGSARLSTPLLTTGSDTKASSTATFIRETPTETRQRVRNTLDYLEVPTIDTCKEKTIAAQLPRTEYHVVPPMNYTTGAVAGQKVENMIW